MGTNSNVSQQEFTEDQNIAWLCLLGATMEWRDKSDGKWRQATYPEIVTFSFHCACDGNVPDQEIISMLGADRFHWLAR